MGHLRRRCTMKLDIGFSQGVEIRQETTIRIVEPERPSEVRHLAEETDLGFVSGEPMAVDNMVADDNLWREYLKTVSNRYH